MLHQFLHREIATMTNVSRQTGLHVVKPWSVTNEKITLATQRLIAAANPMCVILFGSQARGDANPESDADFLVVEQKVEDRFSELARLRHSLKGLMLSADVLVIDHDGFMRLREEPGSVYQHAYREGRCLYGTT
jgi:predicted nucleotidyltransferase